MATTKEMKASLQAILIPTLREKGFKGSLPHFRRISSQKIDLLTFQFDKWGGGFCIEISNCSPGGYLTDWGEKILPNKVTAWDMPFEQRHRIQPLDAPNTDGWFRFERVAPDVIARQALDHLQKAEVWWHEQS